MADVLVVEDDPDIRLLVTVALEDAGHTVRQATDGASALLAIEGALPDAMVMDVMMPGLDGFGVLRHMTERGWLPRVRAMLLTCKTEERDHELGYELGACDYLTKPFDAEQLITRVDAMISASDDDLAYRRREEIDRAQLLDRLEAAFKKQQRQAATSAG
ncbi:MAG: response regulator transcription factor [Acidimicrobiales bacterium]